MVAIGNMTIVQQGRKPHIRQKAVGHTFGKLGSTPGCGIVNKQRLIVEYVIRVWYNLVNK